MVIRTEEETKAIIEQAKLEIIKSTRDALSPVKLVKGLNLFVTPAKSKSSNTSVPSKSQEIVKLEETPDLSENGV